MVKVATNPVERIKSRWPSRALAVDQLLGAVADRVEELADLQAGAEIQITLRIHRGILSEARLDRDERFA